MLFFRHTTHLYLKASVNRRNNLTMEIKKLSTTTTQTIKNLDICTIKKNNYIIFDPFLHSVIRFQLMKLKLGK